MRPDESCGVCHRAFVEEDEVLPVPREQGGRPTLVHALCPSRAREEA